VKLSAKMRYLFESYITHNYQNVTLQSEYNDHFFKSSAVFDQKYN
jgi:hypothetical protein